MDGRGIEELQQLLLLFVSLGQDKHIPDVEPRKEKLLMPFLQLSVNIDGFI